jgi:hypothetical protein
MEVDEPPRTRADNRHDQRACVDNDVNNIIGRLGNIGIDRAFTDFLQHDLFAQVVVGQLLDKIDSLQNDVERANRTAVTLASRMTTDPCKRPASPMDQGPEDSDYRLRKLRGPGRAVETRLPSRQASPSPPRRREEYYRPRSPSPPRRWEPSPPRRREPSPRRRRSPLPRRPSPGPSRRSPPRKRSISPLPKHHEPAMDRHLSRDLGPSPAERSVQAKPAPKPAPSLITVAIPGPLTPTVERAREPALPEPNAPEPEVARTKRLPDELDDSDEDDGTDDDDHKRKPNQEMVNARANYLASRPGRIPNGLGVVIINGKHERDNELWAMTGRYFYHSIRSNQVFAGKTATVASDYEGRMDGPYMTDGGRRLYSYLPRGFPMNPHEVHRGVRFINDKKEEPIDRAEAYRLLTEFHRIAGGFVPQLRDLAMKEILDDGQFARKVRQPFPNDRQLWENFPVRRDEDAFRSNPRNKSLGAGLPPVIGEKMLDIDAMAQYIMHHGRLGSSNPIHGVAMNVALQADRRSTHGYSLGRVLGPRQVAARSDFMREFGCVVALPGYYREAIDIWNLSYPNKPFVELTGHSLTVRPFDSGEVSGLTRDKIVDHLIAHGIPPSWIDHAYTFGLHHLNHYSHLKPGPFHEMYCKTNCERLERIDRLGTPPAIPDWDGWWCPTYNDITRIQLLMSIDAEEHRRPGFQDFEWLPAGASAIFRDLTGPSLRENISQSTPIGSDVLTAGPSTQPSAPVQA